MLRIRKLKTTWIKLQMMLKRKNIKKISEFNIRHEIIGRELLMMTDLNKNTYWHAVDDKTNGVKEMPEELENSTSLKKANTLIEEWHILPEKIKKDVLPILTEWLESSKNLPIDSDEIKEFRDFIYVMY